VNESVEPGDAHQEDEFSEAELAPLRSLRERYQGGLQGLAACDALAAATQWRRPGTFTPVGDLLGGGPFDLPRGAWSDDTAQALCLAESLLECNGSNGADQRQRYRRWQLEGYLSATGQCLGISAAMAQALAGEPGAVAASGSGAAPGEALARLLPVVLRAWPDPALLQRWAAESACATTDSRLVIDACRLLASMLQAALLGATRAQVLRHDPLHWADDPLCAPVLALAMASPAERPAPQGLPALDALAHARWCFASTQGFRAGALQAANLGGDSDLACAIYGQLAGLHYGLAAIPRGWRSALAQSGWLVACADRLLAEALVALAEAATGAPASEACMPVLRARAPGRARSRSGRA
jgi:ADP-ribosyl-[dinitrogen reductase] hydrolase